MIQVAGHCDGRDFFPLCECDTERPVREVVIILEMQKELPNLRFSNFVGAATRRASGLLEQVNVRAVRVLFLSVKDLGHGRHRVHG